MGAPAAGHCCDYRPVMQEDAGLQHADVDRRLPSPLCDPGSSSGSEDDGDAESAGKPGGAGGPSGHRAGGESDSDDDSDDDESSEGGSEAPRDVEMAAGEEGLSEGSISGDEASDEESEDGDAVIDGGYARAGGVQTPGIGEAPGGDLSALGACGTGPHVAGRGGEEECSEGGEPGGGDSDHEDGDEDDDEDGDKEDWDEWQKEVKEEEEFMMWTPVLQKHGRESLTGTEPQEFDYQDDHDLGDDSDSDDEGIRHVPPTDAEAQYPATADLDKWTLAERLRDPEAFDFRVGRCYRVAR